MTLDQLSRIYTHAKAERLARFYPFLDEFMRGFAIVGPKREAAFLATIAVESLELTYTRELGGPSYFDKYDDRKDLGNVEPGDGYRFKGRGLIQITGRASYEKASKALGIDYVEDPTLMESEEEATRVSCWWWQDAGCNEIADIPDFKAVTRRVNGGLTAYDRRVTYYERALAILGE